MKIYQMTEAQLRKATRPPRWLTWLMYASPFLGIVAAQLLWHFAIR